MLRSLSRTSRPGLRSTSRTVGLTATTILRPGEDVETHRRGPQDHAVCRGRTREAVHLGLGVDELFAGVLEVRTSRSFWADIVAELRLQWRTSSTGVGHANPHQSRSLAVPGGTAFLTPNSPSRENETPTDQATAAPASRARARREVLLGPLCVEVGDIFCQGGAAQSGRVMPGEPSRGDKGKPVCPCIPVLRPDGRPSSGIPVARRLPAMRLSEPAVVAQPQRPGELGGRRDASR